MTTFGYTLQLNDSERIALGAALELLENECNMHIANGPNYPALSYLKSIAAIRDKLETGAQQLSGSTFVTRRPDHV